MKAAVLGSPVGHSLSPALHRSAYAELGLRDWSYEAIECDEARLPGLLGSLGADWAGLSLTMPLKRAAIGLLDRVSPLASQIGAVNTVVFGVPADGGDAATRGYNTDAGGMRDALASAIPAWAPATALIIGGGATACSALAALRDLGLRKATVAVRAAARAGDLLAAAERLGISVELTGIDVVGNPGGAAGELIISTVPSGAADQLAGRLGVLAPAAVLDVVYDPWPTRLADAAQAVGATVTGGFDLLLYQAARQVRLMTGLEPPVEAMRSAGLAALAGRAGSEPPTAGVLPAGSYPQLRARLVFLQVGRPGAQTPGASGGPPPTLLGRAVKPGPAGPVAGHTGRRGRRRGGSWWPRMYVVRGFFAE